MSIEPPQLHVAANRFLAKCVEDALQTLGMTGEVLSIDDDFSFGPIASRDGLRRLVGIERDFGFQRWKRHIDHDNAVVARCRKHRHPIVVWTSTEHAGLHCTYLWLISSLSDQELLTIDLPRHALMMPEGPVEFATQAQPMSSERRVEEAEHWSKLKAENAPLRVRKGSALVSAPIDYFDDALLRQVTPIWRKMARIVGMTLGEQAAENGLTSDIVLGARLRTLALNGRVEWRGDISRIWLGEVRLPRRR
jgi:Protein of unknown function/Domain of unknown function (DUF1835)